MPAPRRALPRCFEACPLVLLPLRLLLTWSEILPQEPRGCLQDQRARGRTHEQLEPRKQHRPVPARPGPFARRLV
jgi:hypothetical protein